MNLRQNRIQWKINHQKRNIHLGENNKLEKSIYSSVHTHGENYSGKEISIDSDEKISKENLDEKICIVVCIYQIKN